MANQHTVSILLNLINQVGGPLAAAEGQLKKFSETAKRIGGEMQAMGAKMAIAGAPAMMAGKAAIETQRDLLAIANTAGLLPAAAKKASEAWKTEINAIARATNQTQADLSGALGALVSKGMDPEQALKMLRPIGDAATATGGQISDIARTLYSTYDNLKTPIDEAAKTLDVLATAGNRGAFELKDMAQYFPQMSAAAGLLKMQGVEASASLAAASQIAMKGAGDASTAANNLQNFLLKLTAPDTVAKFADAGKNLSEEMKKGLASGDLIGYMANLINEMTGGDAEKISELFGDQQVKMFLAPMLANIAEYKEIRNAALDAVGTIDQQKTVILQATSEKLKGASIGLNAAMEESKIFQAALEGIKKVAEWFAANPEVFGTLATVISALAIGGTGLVLAGTAISAIGTAVGVIGTAWGAAAAAFAAISTFAAVMGTAAGAAALTAAGTALAAIAGVVAAWKVGFAFGTWISEQIDKAVNALTGGKNKNLGTLIYDLVQKFKGIGTQMYKVGEDVIDGLWKGIQANIRKPLDAIGDLAKKLPQWAKDLLGIKSPSRVFMAIGQNVGEGMVIGIADTEEAVRQAVESMAQVAIYAGDAATMQFIQDQERAILELSGALDTLAASTTAVGAAKRDSKGRFLPADEAAAAAAEWQRTADDIERSLTDALMRGFEGGKDIGKNFVDTIKNYLKSAFLKPIAVNISASIMGAIGMGTAGTASASGMSLINGVGMANSLSSYGAAAQGYASTVMGSTYGTSAFSQQSLMLAQQDAGVSALGGGGMSYGGAAAGALYGYQKAGVAGAVGGGLVGYAGGAALSGALAGGLTGAAAGASAALAAIPVWGWIALAAAAILGGGKASTPHIGLSKEFDVGGATSWLDRADPENKDIPNWMFGFGKKVTEEDLAPINQGIDLLGKGLLDTINGGLSSLGGTLNETFKFSLGFAADGDDKSGGLGRASVDGEQVFEKFKRYSTDAKKGFDEMAADILPRISLIAYQTASGLAPALEILLKTVDASTAGAEEINKVFELAEAWQQTAGYAMAEPVKQALEQIEQAGRSSLQVWQDGNASLRTLLGTFDGTLASAQSLGAATQAQYQMELSLIGQIQGLLQSSSAMFGDSIRDIRMSVMDSPEKYDFLRSEVDSLYGQLQTAFDPTLIGNLAQQINRLSNQAYGLLDEGEKKGASGEFIGYLEDVNALTTERLNASQAQIVQNHKAMADVIEAAMLRVAEQMMAAAQAQQAAADAAQQAANTRQQIDINLINSIQEVGQG